MIDFGFDKLALIGAVALIVIGPEKLPRVARTVGHFIGKAQRYVADVKAEVNRSIELEELQKAKQQFESAARDVGQSLNHEINQASSEFNKTWDQASTGLTHDSHTDADPTGWQPPPPSYVPVRKKWRAKQTAVPRWFKQRQGVRVHVQSGAARVARFRPPGNGSSR